VDGIYPEWAAFVRLVNLCSSKC